MSALTFFNCMLAHSGVSGIFHNAILPLASPRIKYFIHLPSLEKMRYLNVGGQCSGGLGRSMTSSQKSSAYVRNIYINIYFGICIKIFFKCNSCIPQWAKNRNKYLHCLSQRLKSMFFEIFLMAWKEPTYQGNF